MKTTFTSKNYLQNLELYMCMPKLRLLENGPKPKEVPTFDATKHFFVRIGIKVDQIGPGKAIWC